MTIPEMRRIALELAVFRGDEKWHRTSEEVVEEAETYLAFLANQPVERPQELSAIS